MKTFVKYANLVAGLILALVIALAICIPAGVPQLAPVLVAFSAFVLWFYRRERGMLFLLTAALVVPCEARTGGLVNVFLANRDDITTFTFTGGLYTDVTMVATKVFFEFEFEQDTGERRENVTRENGSSIVTHEIEFFIPKLTQTNRDRLQEIIDASTCGMVAIAEDANGLFWVVGYSENFLLERPLKELSDASLSGKAFTDLNGSTIILQNINNEKAHTFTGTVPVT